MVSFDFGVQLREDSTDVTLRLNSPSSSSLYSSKIKGAKRMWGYMNGNKGSEHPLLALGLGQSLNPSDSKTSSTILCKTSTGKTDEHSIDLGLDFQPNVRNVKKLNPSNSLFATVNASHTENAIDLELSLSVGPSESVMTSIKPILSQLQGSLETSEMPMVGDGGAKNQAVKRVLKGEPSFAKRMGVVADANTLAALRVLKAALIIALPMVVADVVAMKVAAELQEINLVYASGTEVGRGARGRIAPKVQKGAQGSTMFCKAHGGGKRCSFSGCAKGAEGSTPFCKGHGGGKRCSFQGGGVCPKSVHGGTFFCVAHGGGKRCAILGCTKSARGRTSFCVRHGGGKRCKSMDCRKSAQGNTDFCKAHGGGKRCAWDQAGSKFGTGDAPCDRFSRTKAGLCAGHDALVQDHCVRGGGTIGISPTKYLASIRSEKMKDVAVDRGMRVFGCCASETEMHSPLTQCQLVSLPEGRVHGGSLMAMLATSSTGIRKYNYHGKYYFREECST
ncbi:hypothetical protein C4D60_Mb06t32720 [Musa balbisiana]|uniref:WRKY19-like zinc finger domain-containing protein n=1 Tax=Musa balbisiana TaxID=52838 RepID=A0A4S8ISC6_MUSBA|nr:hypothetical protein C4D60_Mb06t32720 [Musa balbisiana]